MSPSTNAVFKPTAPILTLVIVSPSDIKPVVSVIESVKITSGNVSASVSSITVVPVGKVGSPLGASPDPSSPVPGKSSLSSSPKAFVSSYKNHKPSHKSSPKL